MDSFFTASGASPPEEGTQETADHDSRRQGQGGPNPLPEELVEALAALLAEALVNDIRQNPDLGGLPPDSAHVATSLQASPAHRRIATTPRTRRPAHAS